MFKERKIVRQLLLKLPTIVMLTFMTIAAHAQGITAATIQSQLLNNGNASNSSATLVTLPPGKVEMSGTLLIPSDRPVHIVGAGKGLTMLIWGRDLGTGHYAISTAAPDRFAVTIEGLTIEGPVPSSTAGAVPAKMSGVHALNQWHLKDVGTGGFYAGVVVENDHQEFTDCTFGSSHYGVYFVKSAGYFDQSWINCDFTGNQFACVGCDPTAQIGGDTFLRCHMGFTPYCFYREEPVAPGCSQWISGCQFLQCQFEGTANSEFWSPMSQSGICGNTFIQCGGMDHRYAGGLPGRPVGPVVHCEFFTNNDCQGAPLPADIAVSSELDGNHFSFDRGFYPVINGGAVKPITSGPTYANRFTQGDVDGIIVVAKVTVITGQIVEKCDYWGCRPYTGKGPIIGVAMNNAPAGTDVLVAQRGEVTALTSNKITGGSYLTPTPGGFLSLATPTSPQTAFGEFPVNDSLSGTSSPPGQQRFQVLLAVGQ